jgi:hypothetical protein
MDMIRDYLKEISNMTPYSISGCKYSNVYEMVLDLGQSFPTISTVKYKQGQIKACYENSLQLSKKHGFIYCEGFAVSKIAGFPLEHAWCIDGDKKVVDITWDDGIEYFGVCFSTKFVRDLYKKTGRYSVFGDYRFIRQYFKNGFNEGVLL